MADDAPLKTAQAAEASKAAATPPNGQPTLDGDGNPVAAAHTDNGPTQAQLDATAAQVAADQAKAGEVEQPATDIAEDSKEDVVEKPISQMDLLKASLMIDAQQPKAVMAQQPPIEPKFENLELSTNRPEVNDTSAWPTAAK